MQLMAPELPFNESSLNDLGVTIKTVDGKVFTKSILKFLLL